MMWEGCICSTVNGSNSCKDDAPACMAWEYQDDYESSWELEQHTHNFLLIMSCKNHLITQQLSMCHALIQLYQLKVWCQYNSTAQPQKSTEVSQNQCKSSGQDILSCNVYRSFQPLTFPSYVEWMHCMTKFGIWKVTTFIVNSCSAMYVLARLHRFQ